MMVEDRAPDTQRSAGVAAVQRAMNALAAKRQAFTRSGPMAILASAYGQEFDLIAPAQVAQVEPSIAVVDVRGPLVYHSKCGDMLFPCFDSYEAIVARVGDALSSSASTVVLRFDSPGGEAAGVHETTKKIQAMAAASGKRLVGYVDELCASAAYALSCACDSVYLPQSGTLGAIGVIERLVDETKADVMAGVDVTFVVTGARKADAHPHSPVTAEVIAAVQGRVDALGAQFFGLVSESRGIPVEAVEGYQASLFQGADAVAAKLATGVCSFDELILMLGSNAASERGAPAAVKAASMPQKAMATMALNKQAKSMLEHLADQGATDEVKAAAKLLLAAFPEKDDKKDDKKDDDESPPSSKPDPKKDEDEEDEKAAKAKADAVATPVAAVQAPAPQAAAAAPGIDQLMVFAAELQAIKAERAAEKEASERAQLLASRSDFDAKIVAMLQSAPMDRVRFAVETFPRAVSSPAAAAQARGTRGETQQEKPGMLGKLRDNPELDRVMGLSQAQARVHRVGCDMVFPAITPEQAKARLAEMAKGGDK